MNSLIETDPESPRLPEIVDEWPGATSVGVPHPTSRINSIYERAGPIGDNIFSIISSLHSWRTISCNVLFDEDYIC